MYLTIGSLKWGWIAVAVSHVTEKVAKPVVKPLWFFPALPPPVQQAGHQVTGVGDGLVARAAARPSAVRVVEENISCKLSPLPGARQDKQPG